MQSQDKTDDDSGQAPLDDCLWCGSNDVHVQADSDDCCYVRCHDCGACGPVCRTLPLAGEAWNDDILSRTPDRVQTVDDRLRAWFATAFPAGATTEEFLLKFQEETDEFCDALDQRIRGDMACREAADVCIVLANWMRHRYGLSLWDAIESKVGVLFQRLTDPTAGRKAVGK